MTGWLRKVNGVSSFLPSGCAENWYCSFCLSLVLISPSPFLALNHSLCGTTNTIKKLDHPKGLLFQKRVDSQNPLPQS